MSTLSPKNYPIYAKHLIRNCNSLAVQKEIKAILDDDARGLNKSLYGLAYYLKKEAKAARLDLTEI